MILLVEEILHHLGCITPVVNNGDIYYISWLAGFRNHQPYVQIIFIKSWIQESFHQSGWLMPGTLNNHFLMDVWWNNHFLCNDLESSSWNNHKKLVVWSSRWFMSLMVFFHTKPEKKTVFYFESVDHGVSIKVVRCTIRNIYVVAPG